MPIDQTPYREDNDSSLGSDIQDAIISVRRELNVNINVEVAKSHGFNGIETVVYVIYVIVGAISAGILQKIGEEIWVGISKIARTIFSRRREIRFQIVARIIRDGTDGQIAYYCEIAEGDNYGELLAAFRATVARLESGQTSFTEDGDQLITVVIQKDNSQEH